MILEKLRRHVVIYEMGSLDSIQLLQNIRIFIKLLTCLQQHMTIICISISKGLRLEGPEGFVVAMYESACEQEVRTESVSPMNLTYCSHKPDCIVTTNPDRFLILASECRHSPFKLRIRCSKGEMFCMLPPLLGHAVPLDDGNCRLSMPVVKGRCTHDAPPHTFNKGVFKFIKTNSTTVKHTYIEYTNRNWRL